MEIDGTMNVGDIAARVPASIEVFEHYGVDFCCNGRRSLQEAVSGTGVSAEGILAEIERALEAEAAEERAVRDWTAESPAALADYIVETHHTLLERELPKVGGDLAKIISVHGQNHPELLELGRVYEALRTELEDHLRKEEELVFPALRELGPSDAPSALLIATLEDLEAEHDGAGSALHAIRGITSNYQTPPDACMTYSNTYRGLQALEADIHRHVHLENNILIPGIRGRLDS
jgi:regulator of cell morphogenesis and NO signaling